MNALLRTYRKMIWKRLKHVLIMLPAAMVSTLLIVTVGVPVAVVVTKWCLFLWRLLY